MFKQMRTLNLKFIGAVLFAVIFLVGGFFITQKVDARETSSFPYSLSPISSYTNSDGGISTVMRVGCLPGSGDVYDINTGEQCSYITSTAKIGCAPQSGHKYDINTGALCLYGVSNVRIGCAVGSPNKYDINTGERCTNKPISVNYTPTLAVNKVNKDNTTTGKIAQVPPETKAGVNSIPKDEPESPKTPFFEKSVDAKNLTANGERISSIFSWPLPFGTILLIIVILLVVAYAVYYFLKKDPSDTLLYPAKKDKNKEAIKPIVTPAQPKTSNPQAPPTNTPPEQPKPQGNPINTPPQSKIPNTPLTHTHVHTPTPNPQIPLNIPNNSGQL